MIFRRTMVVLFAVVLTACSSGGGDGNDEKTPEISIFITAHPVVFNAGQTNLSWTVKNVDTGTAGHSITLTSSTGGVSGDVVADGTQTISPAEQTQYTLTATNSKGSVSKTIDVYTGNYQLLQDQIIKGQSTRLTWDIPGVQSVLISPDYGSQPAAGELDLSPKEPTEFTLSVPELGDDPVLRMLLDVKDPVALEIIATPDSGVSPLNVRFSQIVANNNIVITSYEWDFDSDGTMDVTDTFGAPRTYIYTGDPGQTFTATLTAIPAQGDPVTATKQITLQNSPPVVTVSSNLTNGHAPLNVTFLVIAQDPNGIDTVRIDFDGDGEFDNEITALNTTSVYRSFSSRFESEGNYRAVVQVLDQHGAVTEVTHNAINVDVTGPQDPIVGLTAISYSGNTPFSVTLNASATLYDNDTVATWEWDLDGDGSFETTGGIATVDQQLYTYTRVDNYYPTAKVTTSTGRTVQASVGIDSQLPAFPSINIPNGQDTINVDVSAVSEFTISHQYDTNLKVWIEDRYRNQIITLQNEQVSPIGDHTFRWDGTKGTGEVVSEGDYYVMLSYTAYDQTNTLDLRATTGGQLTYYRRTENNPRTFDRLESPLIINYEVDEPAEVSFFWQVSFGDRLMTLMEHERMGRGSYSMYWNGDYPSGLKIADNLLIMPGIVRYNLPDSVIFVKETPRIERYFLKSTIVVDPRREPIGIDLTLSKPSTVEVVVSDMEKGVDVATRVYLGLTSGEHNLTWNGKNNDDQYLAPGDYRIGVRSVDNNGNRSMFWYRTQRIDY